MEREKYERIRTSNDKLLWQYKTEELIEFLYELWGYEEVEEKYVRLQFDEEGKCCGVKLRIPRVELYSLISDWRERGEIPPYNKLHTKPTKKKVSVSEEIKDVVSMLYI